MSERYESSTIEEVYYDRNLLVLALARSFVEKGGKVWWSESDDVEWPIVYIDLHGMQISYHIPRNLCPSWLPFKENVWDGHTLEEKQARIRKYTYIGE